MITPQQALQRTIEHREIFHDEMLHLMRQIMQGEITPLWSAAYDGQAEAVHLLLNARADIEGTSQVRPQWGGLLLVSIVAAQQGEGMPLKCMLVP